MAIIYTDMYRDLLRHVPGFDPIAVAAFLPAFAITYLTGTAYRLDINLLLIGGALLFFALICLFGTVKNYLRVGKWKTAFKIVFHPLLGGADVREALEKDAERFS
ncbi:MAG: hypothetical protein QMD46_02840 [Methanomicrobiales archaeon]|nr:hypothetical protein [Methanomicrobiales archaeon]